MLIEPLKLQILTLQVASAALDSMTKQCPGVTADVEGTQEQRYREYRRRDGYFSIALSCNQG